MPRSFALPEELPLLCQYMEQHQQQQQQPHQQQPQQQQQQQQQQQHQQPQHQQQHEQQQQQQHTQTHAAEFREGIGMSEVGAHSTMEWETAENGGVGGGVCGGGGGRSEDLWILKTAQHLGRGLKVVTASQLVEEATSRSRPSPSDASATPAKPFVQAQRYIADPLLIQGRKFGLRVWVLVCGCDPMRAYLHVNGLVLFATDKYVEDKYDGASGEVALGHVTNYAQNTDGLVWDLHTLERHLGELAFQKLWARITEHTAHVCAAALPAMRADSALLQAPSESTFELLGFDFLIDSSLHPWLLEVNGTPSLTVEHENPAVEAIIRTQKVGTKLCFKVVLLPIIKRAH
ncbi:tubulin-tyrosine ligase/Tubulin polyglutamylase [Dunaliella salina]|uniref:Tubulin--tyrosine ligase-like protein 5 n=1 Tax=Dunaliella salina TaxID=3046 RepID=A0ABQ7GRZ5_DUNSA|nr:tubulin-tyrosine ligase/Tubulin polyglutamylase [Dunaliella salina]|eukprot:KAF5837382.1 tubulin-tyrosine ligase/Tubulin polyglutamylase [Dunaliella salina]